MSCPWGQLRPALSEPCHVSGYGTEVPNLGLYAKPQCLNLDTWFSEQVWGGLFSRRLGSLLKSSKFCLFLPRVLSLLRSGASFLCDPWEFPWLTGLLKGSFIDRRVHMSAWGLDSAQAGVWSLPFVSCGV